MSNMVKATEVLLIPENPEPLGDLIEKLQTFADAHEQATVYWHVWDEDVVLEGWRPKTEAELEKDRRRREKEAARRAAKKQEEEQKERAELERLMKKHGVEATL